MDNEIRQALRRGSDCPEVEILLSALENTADPSHSAMSKHAELCAACGAEWSLYQRFESPALQENEQDAVRHIMARLKAPASADSRTGAKSWWRQLTTPAWLGGAAVAMAALVLAVGIGSEWRAGREAVSGGAATGAESGTVRAQSVRVLTTLGDVSKAPDSISWAPVSGAATYKVEVREVDRTLSFYKITTTPSLAMPGEAVKLLVPGKTLLVDVFALDARGQVIAESGQLHIRIPLP